MKIPQSQNNQIQTFGTDEAASTEKISTQENQQPAHAETEKTSAGQLEDFTMRHKKLIYAFILFAICNLPLTDAFANTTQRYVSTTGTDLDNHDCKKTNPCLTIQHAIGVANPGDIIQIKAGIYPGSVDVDKSLTLSGESPDTTHITHPSATRIFAGSIVRFRNLSFNNVVNGGAAVANFGTTKLVNVVISNNSVRGIENHGKLKLSLAYVVFNLMGVLNLDGTMTIKKSNIAFNTPPSGISGGGIANAGKLKVQSSAILGNIGTHWEVETSGKASFKNSTISTASYQNQKSPGGIVVSGTGGILNLTNVTLDADSLTDGAALHGFGTVTLKNTILINESFGKTCDLLPGTTLNDKGNNLSVDSSCGLLIAKQDLIGVNPLLLPLGLNGGATFNRLLQNGSPAIDAGTNNGCPHTDQRGVTRPLDGDLDGTKTCDIGAVEM
jgi:hypothetical protein